MILLDSNIIAYAFYQNEHTQRCRELLNEDALINAITLVEAFNIIEYETSREHAAKAIKSLLKSGLRIVDADINMVFEALKRTAKCRLKFIDMIHYVTALLYDCEAIASYDSDFDGLEVKRIT